MFIKIGKFIIKCTEIRYIRRVQSWAEIHLCDNTTLNVEGLEDAQFDEISAKLCSIKEDNK